LIEDGTVRYTGDLVRGTLFVEKVGPFMAAFRARYTRTSGLRFHATHLGVLQNFLLCSENIFANYLTRREPFYRS